MVRITASKYADIASGKIYYEFAGLSTDDKPIVGVSTGSVFIEVNTGKAFMFAEPSTWTEVQ